VIGRDQEFIDWLAAKIQGDAGGAAETNGRVTSRTSSRSPHSDEAVIEKCRAAGNAQKFEALFNRGDVRAYHGGDDSAADLALLSMLAFWTQDPLQLQRIFSSSALGQRAKWRRRDDYRERTIQKALLDLNETYDWENNARSRSLGISGTGNDPNRSIRAVSFRGREKPGPREWIIDRAVCKGHAASWYGEGGIAKSLLAAHMGIHIAADGVDSWAGLRVQTVPVIYGDFELDEDEHLRRSQELAAGMGLPDVPAKFHYLSLVGLPADEAFQVAAEECERLKAALFIVDSVGYALDGDSELARDVLRWHRDCIQPIRDAGATPLLIDHQAKVIRGEKYADKQEFGSVYKTNTVRSSFQIRGGWDGDELTATFTHRKTNFGPRVEDFSLLLRFGRERISVELLDSPVRDPDREPSKKEQVCAAVEELGRATAEEVHATTRINLKTVRNAISELVDEGELVDTKEKKGRSRIVVPGSRTTKGMGTGTSEMQGPPTLAEDTGHQTVADFFANPPDWLPRQLEVYRENPDRHFRPLCKAVAAALDNAGSLQWEDVAGEVEKELAKIEGEGK
jgi:hypothetical protein